MALTFFDTNILVYAEDAAFPDKQQIAIERFIAARRVNEAVLSTQVLQEFYSACTSKLKIEPSIALHRMQLYAKARVVAIEPSAIFQAAQLHATGTISFWDALIVQAASISGASILLSEDGQNGRVLAGVRFENPFAREKNQ